MKMVAYYIVRLGRNDFGYCDYLAGPFSTFNEVYASDIFLDDNEGNIHIASNTMEVDL
jgi:hypothetical protein